MWLFIIFVIVPVIEIALFIQLGGLLGFWPTIGIVILTALIGSALVRSQGFQAMTRLQSNLGGAGDAMDTLVHGFLILVAGIVLVTPGFFTDAVGFSLLIPQVRSLLIDYVSKNMKSFVHVQTGQSRNGYRSAQDDTIEGEFTRVDPNNDTRNIDGL